MTNDKEIKEIYEKYRKLSDGEVMKRLSELKGILSGAEKIKTEEDKSIYRLVYVLVTNLSEAVAGQETEKNFLGIEFQRIKNAESLKELDEVIKECFEADPATASWRDKPTWEKNERNGENEEDDKKKSKFFHATNLISNVCILADEDGSRLAHCVLAAKSARAILAHLELYTKEKQKEQASAIRRTDTARAHACQESQKALASFRASSIDRERYAQDLGITDRGKESGSGGLIEQINQSGSGGLIKQINKQGILGSQDRYPQTKKYDQQAKKCRIDFLQDPSNCRPALPGILAKIFVSEMARTTIETVGLKPKMLRKRGVSNFDQKLQQFAKKVDQLRKTDFTITEEFTREFEKASNELKEYLDTSRWRNIRAGSENAWKAYDDKPFVKYYYCARRLFKDRVAGKAEREGLMDALDKSENDIFFIGGSSCYDERFDKTEKDAITGMKLIENTIRKKLNLSDDILEKHLKASRMLEDVENMKEEFKAKRGIQGELALYQDNGCRYAAAIKQRIDEQVRQIKDDFAIQRMIDRYVRTYVVRDGQNANNEAEISNQKKEFEKNIIDKVVAVTLKRFFVRGILNNGVNKYLLKQAVEELDSKKETSEKGAMIVKKPSGEPDIPVVTIDPNGKICGRNLKDQIKRSDLGVMIDCLSEKMQSKKDAKIDPLDEIIRNLIDPPDRQVITAYEELKFGGVGYIKLNNELRKEIETEKKEGRIQK